MSDAFERSVAARALVLHEVASSDGIVGATLLERIDGRRESIAAFDSSYDFVGWASSTLWEVLAKLERNGYVKAVGEASSNDAHQWADVHLLITDDGRDYLAGVMEHMPTLLGLLEVERRSLAQIP